MPRKQLKELEKKMSLRKSLLGISGIILTCGMVALAQQPQTTTTQNETLKRHRLERGERIRDGVDDMRQRHGDADGLRSGGRMPGGIIRGVQLTDEQRQQSRAIMQRRVESIRVQREELLKMRERRIAGTFTADDEARAKSLRREIRTAMEGARNEMQGILNTEQKARVEELQKDRKERREERMKEHELRMKERLEFRNKQQ